MDTAVLIDHLEALFARLSIPVRYQRFDEDLFRGLTSVGGGLCRLRGTRMVVIDERLAPSERAAVLLRAAASLSLDDVYVLPAIRRELDKYRQEPAQPTGNSSRRFLRVLPGGIEGDSPAPSASSANRNGGHNGS